MRLYLSSHRIGDRAGALLALLGNGKRAAIIPNALDLMPEKARDLYRRDGYDPVAQFAALGIAAEELDLRDYFARPAALAAALRRYDLVWALGGNAFVLRRAMKQSGFDTIINAMLDHDEIVYGGFSAGAVVAAPTLAGMELIDDPDLVPPRYDPGQVQLGLGLVDFSIVPHYRSQHPESAAAELAARQLAARRVPFRVLRDGEVIVWTGARPRATGETRRTA